MQRPIDVVELRNQTLVMRFGLTGVMQSTCVLNVGNYCRLYREGAELRARFTDREDVIVDRFPTDALAENALGVASDALRGNVLGTPAARSRWKRWWPWLVAPLLVLAIIEGWYFYLTSKLEAASPQTLFSLAQQEGDLPVLDPIRQPVPSKAPQLHQAPVLEPAKLAQLLADAAKKEKYSIVYSEHASQEPSQTLYVFSDPNCIYCRRFDGQLKALGQKYTVHLFPVSVVGEEASMRISEQALCMPPAQRASWWEKALQGVAIPAGVPTEACRQAVGDNDQVFRTLQFRGTPTIINGKGEEAPAWVPHTAEALDRWLQSGREQ